MINILIDMEVHAASMKRLGAIGGVNVTAIEPGLSVRPLPTDLLQDKDVLFCTFPPANLAEMKHLEFIQIGSAGYTQLYDLGLAERKIRACNAAGVNDIPIAEWNIAMMVNLARDLRGMIRNQDNGAWDRHARFQREIRGSTLGIWGYGGIGRETARLAKTMGLRVHVLDARPVGPRGNYYVVPGTGDPEGMLPDRVFSAGQERDFLTELDFLVLSLPLTKRTEGIVTEEYLRMLRPHAYVLNPARGPLIVEDALLKALGEGWIAGAALDTHYHYPMPPDHPLWHFPNVIMTPHISGSTLSPRFLELLWDLFVLNVERLIAGENLINELTADQLSGE